MPDSTMYRLSELDMYFVNTAATGVIEGRLICSGFDINKSDVREFYVRLAVCQPISAIDQFVSVIGAIAHEFRFIVEENGKTFTDESFIDFEQSARSTIARKKERWTNLFGGDNEEVVTSTPNAWKYFLAKHPCVLSKDNRQRTEQ
jgi:hypothetical protein